MNTLVVVPTYNESASLPPLVARLRAAVPEADVLITDDASPDGTGDVADALAAPDPRVHVLHRPGKHGLGPAYLAGFAWGLERGYDVLVELDADGSHRPEQLPRLLAALDRDPGGPVGLVIGSRWISGGAVHDWPLHRQLLSRGANLYTGLLLALGVRDATSGYRAFRAATLRAVMTGDIASTGYCFQVDMTRRVRAAGIGVREVPIDFDERAAGASKMSAAIVGEALVRVTLWGITDRAGRLAGRVRRRHG